MSTMLKLIIPLLDETFTKEDFSPEAGFIDAFTEDINKPYIDNCIFLMYSAEFPTSKASDTMHKLRSSKYFYNSRLIYIKGVPYELYAISIVNENVRRLLKGLRISKYEDIMKVIRFWDYKEGDVNTYAFNPTVVAGNLPHSVPEEDYRMTMSEVRQNKKAGIPVIRNLSLYFLCIYATFISKKYARIIFFFHESRHDQNQIFQMIAYVPRILSLEQLIVPQEHL